MSPGAVRIFECRCVLSSYVIFEIASLGGDKGALSTFQIFRTSRTSTIDLFVIIEITSMTGNKRASTTFVRLFVFVNIFMIDKMASLVEFFGAVFTSKRLPIMTVFMPRKTIFCGKDGGAKVASESSLRIVRPSL